MVSYITAPQKTSWMETPPRSPALRHLSWMLLARMPWLDQVSKPLQSWITKLFGQPEEPTYRVKDFLNGVWLGHVLHPVFVTVPLGAWSTTLMLDLAWLFDENNDVARCADMTMWLGLVGAGASAVTGVTNWVDTDGAEQRTGMLHALLNSG